MIQTYEQTWQFYLRMMHYTSRRADFMPYCTLEPIHNFIQRRKLYSFIDWGCGENNHKLAYDIGHMVGIDRTPEANIYGYPDDVWERIEPVDSILAINSVHFNLNVYDAVERIIEHKLKDDGEIFFTINNTGHAKARDWSDIDKWRQMGTVNYYWHMDEHKDEIEKDLAEHLYHDPISLLSPGPTDGADMYSHTCQRTIMQDPFHGLLRVCIKK